MEKEPDEFVLALSVLSHVWVAVCTYIVFVVDVDTVTSASATQLRATLLHNVCLHSMWGIIFHVVKAKLLKAIAEGIV